MPALTADEDRARDHTGRRAKAELCPLVSRVTDTLHAYQLSKRGNGLRVSGGGRPAERGARVNAISPGIVVTPLARDELTGPGGAGYRRMLELAPAPAARMSDEIGAVGAGAVGPDVDRSPAATSLVDFQA